MGKEKAVWGEATASCRARESWRGGLAQGNKGCVRRRGTACIWVTDYQKYRKPKSCESFPRFCKSFTVGFTVGFRTTSFSVFSVSSLQAHSTLHFEMPMSKLGQRRQKHLKVYVYCTCRSLGIKAKASRSTPSPRKHCF